MEDIQVFAEAVRLIACILVVAACGASAKKQEASKPAAPAAVPRYAKNDMAIRLSEEIAAIIVDNGSDCGAMVVAVRRYHDEHADDFKTMRRWHATDDELRDFEERHGARDRAAQELVSEPLQACPDLVDLFTTLFAAETIHPANDATAERLTAAMERIAAAVEHAADCPAMTDAVRRIVEEHRPTFEAVRRMKPGVGENELIMKKYGARIDAATERMAAPMRTCASAAAALQGAM